MEMGREARVVRQAPSRKRDQVGRHKTPRKEIAWHPEGHLGDRQEKALSLKSHFFLLAYTDFPSSVKDRKRKRRRERRGGRARRREKREEEGKEEKEWRRRRGILRFLTTKWHYSLGNFLPLATWVPVLSVACFTPSFRLK